ncbi:NmrA family NAD(P)-binding protein [Roseicyclus persicicus]|uniref:SDR family oxidoreductase n=1 Tax=Roseicyclus persicicus TaxID=2650661 RepID=A0A7X6JWI8_9RHOB|nr:SDR family oxidoreductase [Roseibacterium persicicum]
MRTVFIAGATGYLGRHLCAEYRGRGWRVRALVRDVGRARDLDADELVEAEATRPDSLGGVMEGADLVISALGITRQADGLGYRDVDYQANLNLLDEALSARVPRFAYIHVLNAEHMAHVPLVAAKAAFVRALEEAGIASTVIAPSGYFSDMADVLATARSGRAWLFRGGAHRINPIHGADLARATADAIDRGRDWLDVGGPDIFSQAELVEAAFRAAGKPVKITWLPDWLRRAALVLLPRLTPRRIHGPAVFFLSALGLDMVGAPHGTRHLDAYLAALADGRPG